MNIRLDMQDLNDRQGVELESGDLCLLDGQVIRITALGYNDVDVEKGTKIQVFEGRGKGRQYTSNGGICLQVHGVWLDSNYQEVAREQASYYSTGSRIYRIERGNQRKPWGGERVFWEDDWWAKAGIWNDETVDVYQLAVAGYCIVEQTLFVPFEGTLIKYRRLRHATMDSDPICG